MTALSQAPVPLVCYEATIEPIKYCPRGACLASPYIRTDTDSTGKDNLENLDRC